MTRKSATYPLTTKKQTKIMSAVLAMSNTDQPPTEEETIGGNPEWQIEDLKNDLEATTARANSLERQLTHAEARAEHLETQLEQAKQMLVETKKRAANQGETKEAQQPITSRLLAASMIEHPTEQYTAHIDILRDCATKEEIIASLSSLEQCVWIHPVLRTMERFTTLISIGKALRWQLPKEWTPTVARQFTATFNIIKGGSNYQKKDYSSSAENFSFKTSSEQLAQSFGVTRTQARSVIDSSKGDVATAGHVLFQQSIESMPFLVTAQSELVARIEEAREANDCEGVVDAMREGRLSEVVVEKGVQTVASLCENRDDCAEPHQVMSITTTALLSF